MPRKICYSDLDGVFASYPECWLEFVEARTGKHFASLEELKKGLSYADYSSLKNDYRSSDFKYNLTPKEYSSAFTKFLKERGWFIVISTTRPASHPELQIRTIRWLDKNNILFDDILFCDSELDVISKYPDLSFGVDDEPYVANTMARWGYKMFLMRNTRNFDNLHKDVIVVDSLQDIIGRISNWT